MNEYISGIDDAIDEELRRILDVDEQQLNTMKRAEIALPTSKGGLGIPTLQTIAPITYTASIMALLPMLSKHAHYLEAHLVNSLKEDDQFGVHRAYGRTREHADWHDNSRGRGKAPMRLPRSTEEGIKNPDA